MVSPGIKHIPILIVDGDTDLLDSRRGDLEGAGRVCFTACGGEAALAVLAAEQIDLAVIDLMMRETPGIELFNEIKEKYPRTAILLIGEEDCVDVAVSLIKDGAVDYLVKPVDRAKLVNAVDEALEKQSENLENLGHQQHLEELLVHQSKALENKIREMKALSGMFAELVVVKAKASAAGILNSDGKPPIFPR
jgi:DNA-binding NtrC family response regulator